MEKDGVRLSVANFFVGWSGVVRVVVVGILAYAALVTLLRVSGKRTLAKLNAFDLIVTVALGSTLATILLAKDVALVEGVSAFILLVGLQFAVSWLSVRSARVRDLVTSEPSLLFYQGQLLLAELRRERVTEAEVCASVRAAGFASLEDVAAVVLETDGSITAVPRGGAGPSALVGMLDQPRLDGLDTTDAARMEPVVDDTAGEGER